MAVYPDPQALAELGELLAARHGNEILSADVAFGELTLTIHAKGIVGLVKALIRKLVIVAPARALAYILTFVGILSSIAADAGYLVLIPLAAAAYVSVGRHPLAGLAVGFASVASAAANKKTRNAASDHAPRITAPTVAAAMSASMPTSRSSTNSSTPSRPQ